MEVSLEDGIATVTLDGPTRLDALSEAMFAVIHCDDVRVPATALPGPGHPLAARYAQARLLQIADGPDEVHEMTIARRELRSSWSLR